jgi:hypothetical protein
MTEGNPPEALGALPRSFEGDEASDGAGSSGGLEQNKVSARRVRARGLKSLSISGDLVRPIYTEGVKEHIMAQFMLLLHENPSAFAGLGAEEMRTVIGKYVAWGEKLRSDGKFVSSHKLKEEGGRHMIAGERGTLVTDGPFAEAKEVLGGYFIVEASSYDEAVEIARGCPHLDYGGRIEVRQIDLLD